MAREKYRLSLWVYLIAVSVLLVFLSVVTLLAVSPPSLRGALADIAKFVERVSWPVVVLTIFVLLRDSLSNFVNELAEITFPGGSARRIEAKARDLREESEIVRQAGDEDTPDQPSANPEPRPQKASEPPPPRNDREPWAAPPELRATDAQRITELPPIRRVDRFRMDEVVRELHALEVRRGDYTSISRSYDLMQRAMRTVLQLAPNNKASFGQLLARLRQCRIPLDLAELAKQIRSTRLEMTKRPSSITPEAAENFYDAVVNFVDTLALWWRTNTPAVQERIPDPAQGADEL